MQGQSQGQQRGQELIGPAQGQGQMGFQARQPVYPNMFPPGQQEMMAQMMMMQASMAQMGEMMNHMITVCPCLAGVVADMEWKIGNLGITLTRRKRKKHKRKHSSPPTRRPRKRRKSLTARNSVRTRSLPSLRKHLPGLSQLNPLRPNSVNFHSGAPTRGASIRTPAQQPMKRPAWS